MIYKFVDDQGVALLRSPLSAHCGYFLLKRATPWAKGKFFRGDGDGEVCV